jgi:hypothetical protein
MYARASRYYGELRGSAGLVNYQARNAPLRTDTAELASARELARHGARRGRIAGPDRDPLADVLQALLDSIATVHRTRSVSLGFELREALAALDLLAD